jgi:arachidonate 5-lipoxygenase
MAFQNRKRWQRSLVEWLTRMATQQSVVYTKQEYAERVSKGPVEYVLQIQLHEATDHDSEVTFSSNKIWDEATPPSGWTSPK